MQSINKPRAANSLLRGTKKKRVVNRRQLEIGIKPANEFKLPDGVPVSTPEGASKHVSISSNMTRTLTGRQATFGLHFCFSCRYPSGS